MRCLHSRKRQEWASGSEDVAALCQLALDIRSLTRIYGSSRYFYFQIYFKELLSHFPLFLGSPALSCTLTCSYLLASFSSLSISWQRTHIFTLMLMHILDFAATYVDMLPLETDSTCLGQRGSMGENTKLLPNVRRHAEWWETCQLPRSSPVCSSALPTWYVRRWWVTSLSGLKAPTIITLTTPPHFHPSLVPWFHDSVRNHHCVSSTPKELLLQLPKELFYCSLILSNPMRLPKGKCLLYWIQKLTSIFQLIFVQIISHQILSFLF